MARSETTDAREIVRTEGILGGKPRVEGTRIGVHHIVYPILEAEYTVEHVATVTYPDLSEGDVLSALHYYLEHTDEIEAIRTENERVRENEITSPDDLSRTSTGVIGAPAPVRSTRWR